MSKISILKLPEYIECPKCGWRVPISYQGTHCPICKTAYTSGYCRLCGRFTNKLYHSHVCHECFRTAHNTYRKYNNESLYKKNIATFESWCKQIKDLPFKPITEDEWIKICITLNGCALCGSEDITTRGFFIPYAYGGRYTTWNTIPLCETCARYWESSSNPFEKIDKNFHKANKDKNINQIQCAKTIHYLHHRILEV